MRGYNGLLKKYVLLCAALLHNLSAKEVHSSGSQTCYKTPRKEAKDFKSRTIVKRKQLTKVI